MLPALVVVNPETGARSVFTKRDLHREALAVRALEMPKARIVGFWIEHVQGSQSPRLAVELQSKTGATIARVAL